MKEEQLTVPCVTPSGVESNMTPPPAMNEYSPLDVEDKEIEELLLWTQELNYEKWDYNSWLYSTVEPSIGPGIMLLELIKKAFSF